MKNQLYYLIFLCLGVQFSNAQSTELTPGTVLPQMTTAQRTSVASPKNGMLIFDTDTQSYWYRQSEIWTELPQAGSTSNYWQLNGLGGNEIKNTNSGGFWSANTVALSQWSDNQTNPPTVPVNGNGTRLVWLPSRSAFRVGTVNEGSKSWDADKIGLFSFASGYNNEASGYYSTAMGIDTKASGYYANAIGFNNEASGLSSLAMGYITKANGNNSTSIGYITNASGNYSTAMGSNTISSGNTSTAMGSGTFASGYISTAMGESTTASGYYSTAMGYSTTASEDYSTAMGYNTTASGVSSTAMGNSTTASGNSSTAMGTYANASGNNSIAIGLITIASGVCSTAMGTGTSTNHKQGSFVLGDYVATLSDTLSATDINQFSARFNNGYRLYTDNVLSNPVNYGVSLSYRSNSWGTLSDSTKKERFLAYDPQKVLNSIAAMRIGTWNYKGDVRTEGRHWGVMAQDFYRHFGTDTYGTIGSDTLIATADFDGVSFAAIKALELRTRELQMENEKYVQIFANLKNENIILRKELAVNDEKYMELFADMKAKIKELKLNSRSEALTTKTDK